MDNYFNFHDTPSPPDVYRKLIPHLIPVYQLPLCLDRSPDFLEKTSPMHTSLEPIFMQDSSGEEHSMQSLSPDFSLRAPTDIRLEDLNPKTKCNPEKSSSKKNSLHQPQDTADSEKPAKRIKQVKTMPGELCKVCSDIASGVHFGIFSCEGCKRFFQRAIMGTIKRLYCKGGSKNCLVEGSLRTKCKYCRFQRCIKMGMSTNVIKLGRDARKRARELPQPIPDEALENILASKWSQKRAFLQENSKRNSIGSPNSSSCPTSVEKPNTGVNVDKVKFAFLDGNKENYKRSGFNEAIMSLYNKEMMNSVFLIYLSKLYLECKEKICSNILNPDKDINEFIGLCTNTVMSYLNQFPGVYINDILTQNEAARQEFEQICCRVITSFCLYAIESLSRQTKFTDTDKLMMEQLFSSLQSLVNIDLQFVERLKTLTLNGPEEVFHFTLHVLNILKDLNDASFQNTISHLERQTHLCALHHLGVTFMDQIGL